MVRKQTNRNVSGAYYFAKKSKQNAKMPLKLILLTIVAVGLGILWYNALMTYWGWDDKIITWEDLDEFAKKYYPELFL